MDMEQLENDAVRRPVKAVLIDGNRIKNQGGVATELNNCMVCQR
jgi:hypothetical protein